MQRRKIYIFCDGGFGNRLGSLIGGLITGQVTQCEPVVCWPQNAWCGAQLGDLFECSYQVVSAELETLFRENSSAWYLTHDNSAAYDPSKVLHHLPQSLVLLCSQNDAIIYNHNQIPRYYSERSVLATLRSLRIRQSVLEHVDSFTAKHVITNRTIGIHLRKTDFPYLQHDDSIYELISAHSGVKFFVCSDDKHTEVRFGALKNVITFPKTSYVEKLHDGAWTDKPPGQLGNFYNLVRSRQSVIDAFCDMLVLSRTRIASESVSTFLHFAKLYSNITE